MEVCGHEIKDVMRKGTGAQRLVEEELVKYQQYRESRREQQRLQG